MPSAMPVRRPACQVDLKVLEFKSGYFHQGLYARNRTSIRAVRDRPYRHLHRERVKEGSIEREETHEVHKLLMRLLDEVFPPDHDTYAD